MIQNTNNEDLNQFFNAYQDISIKICNEYFIAHKFDDFTLRLLQFSADFTSIRLMRNTWIDLFQLDPNKFLEFYEKNWSDREVPHYEDILLTICISIITGFFANLFYDKYKNYRTNAIKNQIENNKILKSSEPLMVYLFKIYAIREAYYKNLISLDQFKKIQKYVKSFIVTNDIRDRNSEIKNLYLKIWTDFARIHKLKYDFFLQFIEFVENYYDKYQINIEDKNEDKIKNNYEYIGQKIISFQGMGASRGRAFGIITYCEIPADIVKFHGGEIGLFRVAGPDFVPVERRCSGTIGGMLCGGMTGHLALVCRELGTPCTISINENLIIPYIGYYAMVDGDNGIVTIFSKQ